MTFKIIDICFKVWLWLFIATFRIAGLLMIQLIDFSICFIIGLIQGIKAGYEIAQQDRQALESKQGSEKALDPALLEFDN